MVSCNWFSWKLRDTFLETHRHTQTQRETAWNWELGYLISSPSPHKVYLPSLASSQATSCLFFLNHLFCAGMNTICWELRSTVLAPWCLHEHDLVSMCFKTLARKRERDVKDLMVLVLHVASFSLLKLWVLSLLPFPLSLETVSLIPFKLQSSARRNKWEQ